MKFPNFLFFLITFLSIAGAALVPEEVSSNTPDLFKRKGGGGGGGRGGSSGSSSSSGKSGSSSSSSSSSSGRGSSTSNSGGRTTTGSGVTPRFGGGKYYAGGATVPYKAGSRTPSGLLPLALVGGALIFWSSLWLVGAYMYAYTHTYTFTNETATPVVNETLPVYCICQPYSECGCDDTDDTVWLDDIIGNGSIAALNETLVFVGEVNGTKGIYINGTLPNGTTAAGGTEDPSLGVHIGGILGAFGFWPVAVAVAAAVFL